MYYICLVFTPSSDGTSQMDLGSGPSLIVSGMVDGPRCQHSALVLRDCALVGEGTARGGVTLGFQLIPPCAAVLLPAV